MYIIIPGQKPPSDLDDAKLLRTDKGAGHILIDGEEKGMTLRCAHCSFMWIPKKGSGTKRGFCLNCMAPTCERPVCPGRNGCLPLEKQMDLFEQRKLSTLL